MKFEDIDLVALQRDLEEFAREQQQRGWWKRNWLWFVPTLLVLLILLGGGGIYWALFTRVYHLDVVRAAMEKIESDEGLRRELGQPLRIDTTGWRPPNAQIEAADQDVRWDIAGPKGRAKAHVRARLMEGKWEIVQLEVNGKRVSVAEGADSEAEAPTYTGAGPAQNAETGKPDAANAPPPVINLAAPPDDGPGNTK
jgi:hypothetical protein